jgi:hypothetical protein
MSVGSIVQSVPTTMKSALVDTDDTLDGSINTEYRLKPVGTIRP